MVTNLPKLIASILLILFLSSVYSQAQIMESRALVVASQEAILSSELAARIDNIAVKEMQRFKKGDLLIQFDCSLYEAQKDVVSSNANSALIKLKSDEQMLQMRSIGKYELELSISEYEKAKSELRIAELNVERCQIKAPFDGVISRVPVDVFQVVSAQQAIAELQRPGSIDVSFQMPEQQVRRLQPQRSRNVRANGNTIAWVQFPELPDKRYAASYKEHDSNASQGSLSYEVTVTLPEPEDITVLSGMSATVLLDYGTLAGESAPSWLIPTAALVTPDAEPGTSVVWRYVAAADGENGDNTGSVEPVDVEPGKKMNDGVLVRGELSPGDRIVVAGAHRMNRDRSVRPWEKEGGL